MYPPGEVPHMCRYVAAVNLEVWGTWGDWVVIMICKDVQFALPAVGRGRNCQGHLEKFIKNIRLFTRSNPCDTYQCPNLTPKSCHCGINGWRRVPCGRPTKYHRGTQLSPQIAPFAIRAEICLAGGGEGRQYIICVTFYINTPMRANIKVLYRRHF